MNKRIRLMVAAAFLLLGNFSVTSASAAVSCPAGALADIGRCYQWERREKRLMPVLRCEASQLNALRERSPLHATLLDRLRAARVQGGLNCGLLDASR